MFGFVQEGIIADFFFTLIEFNNMNFYRRIFVFWDIRLSNFEELVTSGFLRRKSTHLCDLSIGPPICVVDIM